MNKREADYFISLKFRIRKYAKTAQIDMAHTPAEKRLNIFPEKVEKLNIKRINSPTARLHSSQAVGFMMFSKGEK